MRLLLTSLAALCFAILPLCAEELPPMVQPCSADQSADCGPSSAELKKARQYFQRGMKLQKHQPEEALAALDEAVRLSPRDPEYATAREVLRQQLVSKYVRRGNDLITQKRTAEGSAEFRMALALDPENQFASER